MRVFHTTMLILDVLKLPGILPASLDKYCGGRARCIVVGWNAAGSDAVPVFGGREQTGVAMKIRDHRGLTT